MTVMAAIISTIHRQLHCHRHNHPYQPPWLQYAMGCLRDILAGALSYMHICVCMYVCMYVCIYIYMLTYMHNQNRHPHHHQHHHHRHHGPQCRRRVGVDPGIFIIVTTVVVMLILLAWFLLAHLRPTGLQIRGHTSIIPIAIIGVLVRETQWMPNLKQMLLVAASQPTP